MSAENTELDDDFNVSGRPPARMNRLDVFSDPVGWRLNHRINFAVDAAKGAGETIRVPGDWRTADIPLGVRERLAHWTTVLERQGWQSECARLREDARSPFVSFEGRIDRAIPPRYSDALPLPAPEDAGFDVARAVLRARVKNAAAYTAARAAAIGMAEDRVHRVLLLGPSGSGKTTIAALMLRTIGRYFAENWEKWLVLPEMPAATSPDEFLYRPEAVKASTGDDGWRVPRAPLGERARLNKLGAWQKLSNRPGFHVRGDVRQNPVQWATARDVFMAAAAPRPLPRHGEEPEDPMKIWKNAPLLVLDDVGGEPEQRNVEAVDGILWHRHDQDKMVFTIVTTGFYDERAVPKDITKADEREIGELLKPLAQRYGAALVRRIAEPGQVAIVPVIPKSASKREAA